MSDLKRKLLGRHRPITFWRILLILSLTLSGLPSWGAGERLPVWQLRSGQADVVLLGSVHMAYPDTYPLRAEIEAAFAAADTLVVEVDISGDNGQAIQQLMLQRGLLPEGETLAQQLSEKNWQGLQRYLRSRGLPLAAFERLQPGLVVALLSSMRIAEMGMRPELGIDLHFLEQAAGEKTVLELETPEQQINMLLDFPNPDLLVGQTLVQLDQIDLYLKPIYQAWLAGDAEQLDRLILQDELQRNPEFASVFEALFDRRNLAMTEQIEAMLQGSGRYFVVVGAGHLVGAQGIIALLQRRGYSAQQL